MLEINGKPMIQLVLENLKLSGFKDFYISVNYKEELIKKFFKKMKYFDVNIKFLHEKKKLGTIGALSLLKEQSFKNILVINSDVMTNINFDSMLKFHNKHKSDMTIGVKKISKKFDYGIVMHEKNKVVEFQEKPNLSFDICAGVYIFSKKIVKNIPKETNYDVNQVITKSLNLKKNLKTFQIFENWSDIGNMKDYNFYKNVLKNKKILITGAGGFIGSHLVDRLIKSGHKVTALCKYNSSNSWGWLDQYKINTKKNLKVILGDIRDENFIDTLISKNQVVFHLAALIGIPYSYIAPKSYLETNISGTMNILNSSLRHKIKKVLITSTSEVYGTTVSVPMTENHILQAQSPYSASKISADKITESYFRSFDLPVTIVRPFNTYGPRQSERAIIPTVIGQILNKQKKLSLVIITSKRL